MPVHADLRQGAYIDLELLFSLDILGKYVIEAVYAFYDKDLSLMEFRDPLAEHFLALKEVKFRDIGFPACKQILHLTVEQIKVKRAQTFKVRFAVRTERIVFTLYKIIIRSQIERLH